MIVATARHAAACGVLLALGLLLPVPAGARTLTVPDDLPTIQAALDTVFNGFGDHDSILVRAGDYPERLRCRSQVSMIGLPDGSGQPPVVDALSLADEKGGWSDILFRNLRFRGAVFAAFPAGGTEFRQCSIDSGIVLSLDTPSYVGVIRSVVEGRIYVNGGGVLMVDSCQIHGWIDSPNDGGQLSVLHSVLTGPASTGIAGYAVRVTVIGSAIRGYDTGMRLGADYGPELRDNVVEDCSLVGIRMATEGGTAVGNRVTRCGTGIDVGNGGPDGVLVRRNVVLDCSNGGMRADLEYQAEVDSNVVGRSGGDGIRIIDRGGFGSKNIRNNTTFSNAGSGLVISSQGETVANVANNIACGNGGYGLLSTGPLVPTVSCNDWYANVAGAVGGMDSTGTGFAFPPGFCDLAAGDVRLRSDSPLLDSPGCGLIGALGQGCDVQTSTLVTLFIAERTPDGVRILWQTGPGATATDLWLERSDDGSIDWMRTATEQSREGEAVAELDRSARADRAYWYRLMAREEGESRVLASPVRVDAVAVLEFGILAVAPSPSVGAVLIEFRLAREAPVSIDLFDLAGRRVATLVDGTLQAGEHRVEWSGLDARGAQAPAGVYAVRYRYPGGQQVRRLIRSR